MYKVPTILQMEAAECGAASLAMILAYYGRYVPLEELRIACGVSRDGSNAGNVLKAALNYGLIGKGYRMELQALKKIEGPMIIHWQFNHFLVIEGFKKGNVYINDPRNGRRKVTEQEFDQSFTGVVLTFKPAENFKKQGQKPDAFKTLVKKLKGSEGALVYVFLTGLAISVTGLIIPAFSRIFIDDILLKGNNDWLGILLSGMILTACLRGIAAWLQKYCLLQFENKIAISSSGSFLWHILRLPIIFFNQRYAGDISSRVQNNDKVARTISGQLAAAILNAVMVFLFLLLMIRYDAGLTSIGVMSAILNFAFLRYISLKRGDENNKLLQDRSKMYGTVMAGLHMIETIKATGSESDFFAKWAGYNAKVLNGEQKIEGYGQQLQLVSAFITNITNAIVLIAGAFKIFNGLMTIGMLVAFQSLLSSFLGSVTVLVNLGRVVQELQCEINRLDDVIKYSIDDQFFKMKEQSNEIECTEYKKQENLCKLEGHIEMRNITFGYNNLEPPLIENFNLILRPGSRVALVGGSGSGKSTVIKLLTGIYKPWSGEILLDGKLKKDIPKEVITNSLAVVEQEICMFEGSIWDNLTLWDNSIPEIDLVRGAKDACVHDDIVSREGGYDYIINEGGRNFSGGQRQRFEIARALSINPSILILDEATSALDPVTELNVDRNIYQRGCTCLIAAHRLSTIRDCDEIIVMEDGKIVQRGTHDEMKVQDGPYATLISS